MSTLRPKFPTYRVRRGDTLWRIAEHQYGNPNVWPEISKANRLPNPDLILVGLLLKLPAVQVHNPHAHSHSHSPGTPKSSNGVVSSAAPPHFGGNSGSLRPAVVAPTPSSNVLSSPASFSPNATNFRFQGSTPAKSVLFPAAKYKFDDIAAIVIPGLFFDVTMRLIGELSLQRKGTMTEVELSQRQTLQGKLKTEYDSTFADLIGQAKVGFNAQTRSAQVAINLAVAAKFKGHVFSITQVEVIPPDRFRFTYKPTPISGEWHNVVFAGNIGIELEIRVKKPDGPPTVEPSGARSSELSPARAAQPVPARKPEISPWAYVTAGALIVAGSAIIVADVVKDFGTVGIGLAESPLSFSAAAALFARAAMMTP